MNGFLVLEHQVVNLVTSYYALLGHIVVPHPRLVVLHHRELAVHAVFTHVNLVARDRIGAPRLRCTEDGEVAWKDLVDLVVVRVGARSLMVVARRTTAIRLIQLHFAFIHTGRVSACATLH